MMVSARGLRAIPLLTALAVMFPACVFWPHTSEDSPAIKGQIVDAVTLQPVSGARISFHEHPKINAVSDASGWFRFHEQDGFYLGYTIGPCTSDWPDRGSWMTVLDITHPDYQPYHGYVETDPSSSTEGNESALRQVCLVPRGR
jgi:hypothetical protein